MPEGQFEQIWEMYVSSIKTKSQIRAQEIAEKDGRHEISAPDVFDALREYMPGYPVVSSSIAPIREPGWWNKNVTGFIGITAALTLLFGVLGLLPFFQNTAPAGLDKVSSGFLEIAKIFAGALVGGAAGAATAAAKK